MRYAISLSLVLLTAAALGTTSARAEVSLQKVGDFERPVYVAGAPGDDSRLYVVEQRGTIRVVENGVVRQFLDLRDAVRGPDDADAGGEEGLLSMAFPPDFQASRRFYVYYTDADGSFNRVDELRAPTGATVDLASRRLVIPIPHREGTHHNGGQIQFAGNGRLYIAPGDGGTGGVPARDLESLHGKILRIDPRGSLPGEYEIPAGNPFAGQIGRRDEIWAYGLRNPFRFSFDRATGDLIVGDVGEKTTEEIDYLPAAGGLGRGGDLGWNACEGSFKKGTALPCPLTRSIMPAIEKSHSDGYKSLIAGYVVRDPSLPSLFGRLVYGDFYVDGLRSAVLGSTGARDDREIGPSAAVHRLTSFGEDAAGCVYATSFEGGVHRLVENDVRVPCAGTAATPPEDAQPPALRTRAVQPRQAILKRNGAVVQVHCGAQACRVSAGGTLKIGKRSYRLRRVTVALAADQVGRVRPRLTRAGRRALRKALANRRAAWVTVVVRARDAMGNTTSLASERVLARR
jgi:hypothetical protein